ncbi:hypothetical protein DPMN_121401 [Dreissena polymorpha]|uniref:Uncharacterized protein n=1 Tax=Dreissena polymorpha TaxID=45954 RepID=A0A9D4GQF5_DREPO|nr:hypothetical protein DPMN_121401 [Dreissena polymorpha]
MLVRVLVLGEVKGQHVADHTITLLQYTQNKQSPCCNRHRTISHLAAIDTEQSVTLLQ